MKKNLKPIIIGIAAVLVLIVILQNTTQVDTRILFLTITMPRALLLAVVAALGFLAGLLMGWKRDTKRPAK